MFDVRVWQFITQEYSTIFTGTKEEAEKRRLEWFNERERSLGHTVDISRCIIKEHA